VLVLALLHNLRPSKSVTIRRVIPLRYGLLSTLCKKQVIWTLSESSKVHML